ncbi:MAG: restriction endonuclease subunit S [Methyloprofundus sp.]|nr:restriction endonuclease subunit S [Methyloprofundus sp.]
MTTSEHTEQSQALITQLITDNLATWTGAIKKRSATGRGSNKKIELAGIKKLRELILELAVRGKLVPQDPNDEPASVLLEKIAAEKAQLIKDKKIKKTKGLPEIGEGDKPFELPKGWEWSHIADIGYNWGQKKPETQFTYIDVGSINKELGFIDKPTILSASKAPSRARKIVKNGTVIYSTVRPYLLNIAVINKQFTPEPIASTAFAIIHPFSRISSSFIYRYLRSPSFIKYVESCQTGIAYPAINDKQFFSGLFPIPPLAEQHRIVAKVDQLMVLCDQLEESTEDSLSAHQCLVEALLASLTNSENAAEFKQNWARISAHFDLLFSTEHSIEQLKQTILQLAVMGKLVPQDPNDEPASILLEKIAVEKTQLIKDKKIKKQKPLPAIGEDEQPFSVPDGWLWSNLSDLLALVTDGDHQAPPKSDSGVPFLVIGNLNTGSVSFDGCRYVPTSYFDNLNWGRKPTNGDMLYTVTGSYGIPIKVISNNQFCVQRHVAILKATKTSPIQYLGFLFLAKYSFEYATEIATGIAQKTVPLTGLRKMPIAVPPEQEQHRIVKKVDELISLCEQLTTRLNKAQNIQCQLADTLVNQALKP